MNNKRKMKKKKYIFLLKDIYAKYLSNPVYHTCLYMLRLWKGKGALTVVASLD
jgi:hypothetical protein